MEKRIFKLVAALIVERRHSVGVDYELVKHDLRCRVKNQEVQSVLQELRKKKWLSANMLAVACCDALRLGTRRRRKPGLLQIPELLKKVYPNLTDPDAQKLALDYSCNPKWIDEVIRSEDGQNIEAISLSIAPVCPSKVFPVSRRMVFYWRHRELFGHALNAVGNLAHDHSNPTPSNFIPQSSRQYSSGASVRWQTKR